MRFLGVAADRLLGLVLPGLTAGACCTSAGHTLVENCGTCAGNGIGLGKKCVVTCICTLSCGACTVRISNPACR